MKTFAQLPQEIQATIRESIHAKDDYTLLDIKEMLEGEAMNGRLRCMNCDGNMDEGWYGAQDEGRALNALEALEPYL